MRNYWRTASMRVTSLSILILGMCLLLSVFLGCSHPQAQLVKSWDRKAAATYLDQREGWWMGWSGAARDHGTFCVSCHTSVAYALSRPNLRTAFAEEGPSVNERKLVENVRKRVHLWKDVEPFYSDRGYK